MNTKYFKIILLIFLLPTHLIGQEIQWYEYELENILVEFPSEDVFQLDTIINGTRVNQIYTEIEGSILMCQKLPAENKSTDDVPSNQPHDYESLIDYYDGVVEGLKNSLKAQNVDTKEIKFGELIGYNAILYNNAENPFFESNIFLVENSVIVISIYNPSSSIEDIKKTFFNSLNLDNLESINQYTEKSNAYRVGYIFGQLAVYIIIGIGLFLVLRAFRRRK